jgi:hypothetical protein
MHHIRACFVTAAPIADLSQLPIDDRAAEAALG